MKKVLILPPAFQKIPGGHHDMLATIEAEPVFVDRGVQADELVALVRKWNPVAALAHDEPWTEAVFAAAPSLKVISRHGTGTDNVDKQAARKYGVGVANTPGTTRYSTSELTLFLLGAALRRIPAIHAALSEGRWEQHLGSELFGKKVALFGFGNIGRLVTLKLLANGANVTALNRTVNHEQRRFVESLNNVRTVVGSDWGTIELRPLADYLEVLPDADIVLLHLAANGETAGFVDLRFLATCKRGAIMVNTSRAALIRDDLEVINALDSGQLGHYAVDVFRSEPVNALSDTPLLGHPSVTVTPHVGWYTGDNIVRQLRGALENIRAGLAHEPLPESRTWVVEPSAA